MIRKGLISVLCLASMCAVAAPDTTPTYPVEGYPSIALPQPIFFKAITPGWHNGIKRVYYGLANRIIVFGTSTPMPDDYTPVFMFSRSLGAPKLVYMNEIRAFDFTGEAEARLMLKSGEHTTIDAWHYSEIPTFACAPGTTKLLQTNCRSIALAGALLDDTRGTSFSDTSLSLHEAIGSLELIEGTQAVAAFNAAKVDFEKHRMAEKVAAAAAQQATLAWRKGLKEGSATNCGMVIERKKDIANIQMQNGTRWIRLESLSPVGTSASCN